MASVTVSRRRNAQPARGQRPNVGLLGPGAFVWSAAQPGIVSAHGGDRFGTNSGFAGRAFAKTYQGAYWTAASGDGLRVANWLPRITDACTVFVVAAPAAGNSNVETAFAISQVGGKFPSLALMFNANYYGSATTGNVTLAVTSTTTEYAEWGYHASIDGAVHCWAAGADRTSGGYVLQDGADIAYIADSVSGTITDAAQQLYIGAHPAYDGARAMTSPLYLVAVTPRKLPMEIAAALSRQLLRSASVAFAKESVQAFRTTSAGAAFAARYYYDMIASGGRLGG